MNDPVETDAPLKPQDQDERVPYFRIDFERCLIERGDRARRPAQPTTRQGVLPSGSST